MYSSMDASQVGCHAMTKPNKTEVFGLFFILQLGAASTEMLTPDIKITF